MWKWAVIGWILLKLCVAAPPLHIDRLALFPDKSAWCEAKNITQIIGHTGCQPHSIQNRACLGQCFSYSVPNTFPQLTESLVHCDSCMPVQMQWEVITLACPGNKEMPHVDKLVERILQCSCQSCDKEAGQQGALLQLFPSDATPEPPARGNEGRTHGRPGAHAQHAHAQHPHAHAQHAHAHAQHAHAQHPHAHAQQANVHAQHAHAQHPHAHAQQANVHAQHAHAHPDSHPHPQKPAGG